MGILHSTSRSLASKQENEEEKDLVERPSKLLILSILIYKTKGLICRVGSILFSLLKPKKAAVDPLLPVQDPAPNTLRQPLILETPPISPSSTTFDDDELDDDLVLSLDEDNDLVLSLDEDKCSPYGNQSDDHVVVSPPRVTWEELTAWATALEEGVASRNIYFLDEISLSEEQEDEQDEEEEIKSVIVVREERWIKHYSSGHRILLVGEGDFSFSACLALAFGWASNMVATSLDSRAFLVKNYGNALSNLVELSIRKCTVMHEINVTEMRSNEFLAGIKFDRIIFNFPYAGFFKNLPRDAVLRRHRRLVSEFMENAKEMMSENGEIHITHKTNSFHKDWNLVMVASLHRLRLVEAVDFDPLHYPGYNSKYGFGGDNNFDCRPSMTYKFRL